MKRFDDVYKYNYPTTNKETVTYSDDIQNYRNLSASDKRILVNDPIEFQRYVFWWQNLPVPTRDQMFMMQHLSAAAISKDQEPVMLQAQRGLAKSLTVQILTNWLLLRNKDEKIVVVSATGRRASSFTLFCLNMLNAIPLLNHMYPTGDQRSSGKSYDIANRTPDDSPSVAAFGVTAAKTGSRATFIIYDDVEIPENSDTAQKREKILAGVRDTANLGVSGAFREVCICTPQSAESVYNTMVKEDGFSRVIIPSEYPDDISVYEGDLAKHIQLELEKNPSIVGLNTDPRQNMIHLEKQRMKGKARYKLQYMLDTTLSDAEKYPLKLSDLIVMDLDNDVAPTHIEYSSEAKHTLFDIKHDGFRGDFIRSPRYYNDQRKEYEGIAMFVDPSGRGTDETAWCVTAQMGGRIFLLDLGGLAGGYDNDSLVSLAEIAKRYSVNLIRVESNFGDGSFAELLKPHVSRVYKSAYRGHEQKITSGVMIEDVRATTQKEKRIIETLEPVMMQHRLVANKKIFIEDAKKDKMEYRFSYQLTHITEVKDSLSHDDLIDVLEMGVGYWTESLARDTEEEKKRYERQEIEKSLDKFREKCGVKKAKNFMDRY